ncbi:MAG TPA: hypothetical protein VEF05_06090 [Terriglobales bacterium]|nr:hypothetical protein [Terriglobales bacterium]
MDSPHFLVCRRTFARFQSLFLSGSYWGLALVLGCVTGTPLAQVKAGQSLKPEIRRTFPLTKFYDTPHPLPAGKPGELIRKEEVEEYDLPPGVLAVRILYHSRSAAGEDVATSGVVLHPDANPPPGGWPLIAWAHDLKGVARQCAPSLVRNLQHGPFLSMYVNLGYAVVATDYTGLGTNFRSAFSDMQSNALDVIYSIPAARAALPQLGSRWITIGTGEGGLAAVGVSERESEIRDQNYLGAILISGVDDLQDRYAHPEPASLLFLAYGTRTVYPDFEVRDVLTEKALPLYARIEQACGEATEIKLSASEMLKPGWENNRFVKEYFNRNRPGQRQAFGPLLVIAGGSSPGMPASEVSRVMARICGQGDRVQFENYAEADPGSVIGESVRDQISWIQGRFAGRPAPTNCSEPR